MPAGVFGLFELNGERVAQLVVNLLAIAGGYLAGFLGTGLLAWFLDRRLTGGKSPPGLVKAVKTVGGVAAALLVALIVFGHGAGWTLFGGGGPGSENGGRVEANGKGDGPGQTVPTPLDTRPTSPTPTPVKDLPPPEQRVRVTLLGGADVRDEKFYLLDDDPAPRALPEVKAAVAGKKTATAKPVGIEIRFSPTNTLPQGHPAVLLLTTWAQSAGHAITFPSQG